MEALLLRLCRAGGGGCFPRRDPEVPAEPVEETEELRRMVRLVWTSATLVGVAGRARRAAAAAAEDSDGCCSWRWKTAAAAMAALRSTLAEAKD